MAKQNWMLIVGDLFAIVVVTLVGFATHNVADFSYLMRMAIVFFPLSVAWFLLSPWLGLFQQEITSNSKQLWRPALGMIFAASLAVVIRGLILGAPIIPVFAAVLSATSALGMLIWRGIYFLLKRKN